tara:strand:+ start:384 stop:890 length:507 start_codon:yes stop_codon:yes gene_type:complete
MSTIQSGENTNGEEATRALYYTIAEMSKKIEDQEFEIKAYKLYIAEMEEVLKKATEIVQSQEQDGSFENVGNKLANADELKSRYGDDFKAPDKEDISSIDSNYLVKVCYKSYIGDDWNGERFWVDVVHVEDNIISGLVSNSLVNVNWQLGKKISFPIECVYDYKQKSV